MAATQTQHSTGWNSKAEGTQDAERNPWYVQYAPLVVKRPAPCQPTEAGSTGRVNFKVFRSKNAVQDAPTRSQIASALDQQALEKVMQDGAELISQRQLEIVAKQREEESFKSAGATQVWKSQSGRASRQATAPKQRKKQAADAGEIMARLASEGRANARNKRPRSDEGAVPPSNTGSLSPSPEHAPGTRTHAPTQATPASGPSASRPSQKPPPAKKQKQSRQRRGATFVVD